MLTVCIFEILNKLKNYWRCDINYNTYLFIYSFDVYYMTIMDTVRHCNTKYQLNIYRWHVAFVFFAIIIKNGAFSTID